MRPLDRVPPPFGREWALIPPHFSLRTELHALYAALLRTVCLSAEAFRKVCRWESGRRTRSETPRPAAAPVGAKLDVAQAQRAAAASLQRKAAGASAASASMAADSAPVERTPPRNHKLTASAVGIGGAALLAWIVASHVQVGESKRTPEAASKAPVNQDASASQRLAEARASHDLSYSGSVVASAPHIARGGTPATDAAATSTPRKPVGTGVAIGATVVAQQPNAAATTAATSAAIPAATSAAATSAAARSALPANVKPAESATPAAALRTPKAAPLSVERHDYAAAANPNTPMRATLAPKAEPASRAAIKAKARHASAASSETRETRTQTARGNTSRHAAHEFAPQHSAPLAVTRRAHGAYSTAEMYSPRQHSVEAADDYASVTTYAVTHAAPQSASRASTSADGTEWVNHVSQRRVTEVPDRFSK
ncbi:hypothetical protein [Paraburkholderia sp. J94]|uniref:hypothetical protein n=1 Tax=Paraburkholderia sp. J94 TaxID=2805441 RepID=UPI002AB1D7F2|nr:hypothetical protein [Paraburkholderia sp. J94]